MCNPRRLRRGSCVSRPGARPKPERAAAGRRTCGRRACPARHGARPDCRRIPVPRQPPRFAARRRPGQFGAHAGFAGELQLHVLQTALGECQEDDAVIGGHVDQAVAGEILEHAFADAIIGGLDAERERMTGVFGRLDGAAVHRDHLAELEQITRFRFAQRADAVFGNDLAHLQRGLGFGGGLADARRKCEGDIRARCSRVSWVRALGASGNPRKACWSTGKPLAPMDDRFGAFCKVWDAQRPGTGHPEQQPSARPVRGLGGKGNDHLQGRADSGPERLR